MSVRQRVLRTAGAALGVAGLAAAGGVVDVAIHRRAIAARPKAGDKIPLGSLRSRPITVVCSDGVPLHVEVDEPDAPGATPLTVVFAHGYCLTLDSWHFQRAGYRGLVRTVFYDQRSHGRSGRSDAKHATIDQLAEDLLCVLEQVAPEGPVVLVGHSMGGMTIAALAEQHPELFGERIVGVALISTTAGGLDVGRILMPLAPARIGGNLVVRGARGLSRGHRGVDAVRKMGRAVAEVATDRFAFGDEVPSDYVRFVDEMLGATPFEVVAQFLPSLHSLDKFDHVGVLARVPTAIMCGTRDRLTSIGHSRKLASRIEGATLLELERTGHMAQIERHDQVNAVLDQLLAAATEQAGRR
ncbi:alpha/beta fold hydrolase [Nocardioides acrostichi]|uniref:Alpha/beta hydrolase n=1 Tax=Nocardioides acrostichi TaxID=2784339 RepID=A0A930V1E4_9ACTN|nr:alpha/beta hydrolase [Nocardioides acrostichi]MBF4162910.1 alpha/beta hydrolase [Nocardioides acrostichi]